MVSILLATWNETKVAWLKEGFMPLNIPILQLDRNEIDDVEEDGATCAENAMKKSNAVGVRDNTIVIAEDSGLFVQALGQFPGVKTARWAPGTDFDRSRLLIDKLDGIEDRSVLFRSSISILYPDGENVICTGELHGKVAQYPRGPVECGYATIFQLPSGLTMAETSQNLVKLTDHRRKAMEAAVINVKQWLNS